MENLGAELAKLTPEQRQAIMMQAQQEANQTVMQEMMKQMTGDKLDSREQSCLASCQDRYLETRQHVQEALQKRQGSM